MTNIYEVVESRDKHLGWANYLASLDGMLRNPMPTSAELKTVHRLVASPVLADLSEEFTANALKSELYTVDREDGEEKTNEFRIRMEYAQRLSIIMDPTDVFRLATDVFTQVCQRDTKIELDIVVPGELRKLGRRRIANGDWTTVHYSHATMYPDAEENKLVSGGTYLPKTYFGLSTGLSEVYDDLCKRYDKEMSQRKQGSLDDRLVAEGFLQLIGAKLLHPFWDGNGRAFLAHASLMLEREGIPFRDLETANKVMNPLAQLNEQLLGEFLETAGLDFIIGPSHLSMKFDYAFRKDYMAKLKSALQKIIEEGLNPKSDLHYYFSNAGWQIKKVLINNGLIGPSEPDEERLNFENLQLLTLPAKDRERFLVVLKGQEPSDNL